jgi:hypothetical protein
MKQQNRLAWMGSGWTTYGHGGDTPFYMNEIDYPPVPEVAVEATGAEQG